jgi:hypothetical protein
MRKRWSRNTFELTKLLIYAENKLFLNEAGHALRNVIRHVAFDVCVFAHALRRFPAKKRCGSKGIQLVHAPKENYSGTKVAITFEWIGVQMSFTYQ